MKTTITSLGGFLAAGILVTGCVSSKKYHRSQDEVARLRTDSTTLAQKGSSLQESLTSQQQKTTELQQTYANEQKTNADLKKNVAYYHDYFNERQTVTSQLKDNLSTTLTPSGLNDADVTTTNGKVYVTLAENTLFRGNSANLSPKGKKLITDLGEFVKSQENVDVTVADLQNTSMDMNGTAAMSPGMDNNGTTGSGTSTVTSNTTGAAYTPNTAVAADGNSSSTTAKTEKTSSYKYNNSYNNSGTTTTKYAHHSAKKSAESGSRSMAAHHTRKTNTATVGEKKSVAYNSGKRRNYTRDRMNNKMVHSIAWKRENTVADALLRTGIPKVKLVSRLENGSNADGQKGVQVILSKNADDLYKHMSDAPAGQPVSRNP